MRLLLAVAPMFLHEMTEIKIDETSGVWEGMEMKGLLRPVEIKHLVGIREPGAL